VGCHAPLAPEVVDHARQAAARVDCAAIHTDVDRLVTVIQQDESTDGETNEVGLDHLRAAAFAQIRQRLTAMGIDHEVHTAPQRHVPVENIVVTLPGTRGPGGAPSGEVVHLTAHYDTWGPGADDNASGVATAMEAARVLQSLDHSRTIQILFYDMEETGLDGSFAWWETHPGAPVTAVVNLDAIAYTGPQTAPPGFRLPAQGDFIVGLANGPADDHLRWMVDLTTQVAGSAPIFGVDGRAANELPVATDFHRSDHDPAWQRGVPAIFLTDTANLRNPHYHRGGDLPETLDRDFHCGVSRLAVASVAAFAEAP